MVHSTLFNLLYSATNGSWAEKDAALVAVTANLRSLPSPDAGSQLTHRGGGGKGVLHLLPRRFWKCEQAGSFLSLAIERGRESCGATALLSLRTNYGATPLHYFAYYCRNLSLTKMVLREHPPSLAVLTNGGWVPLRSAQSMHGSTSEVAAFFRTMSVAFNASNFVALQTLCDGSSPYLSLEIRKQTIALRAAVAICLNRQEEAPSALISAEFGIALALLERVRDFGRIGNSSDLFRRVIEYVGPQAISSDAE